jgi:hypothetical protein
MFFIFHIMFFDEYSLVLILNKMLKKLKSVTKKLFEGKSRAEMEDTLFQGSSSATSKQADILKHIDPTLVSHMVCFQRNEVIILIFSYHFAI